MEPYTVALRIRRWKGEPAHRDRVLWLGPKSRTTEHIVFGPDTIAEVTVKNDAMHRVVRRATHGGGFEVCEAPGGDNDVTEDDPLA